MVAMSMILSKLNFLSLGGGDFITTNCIHSIHCFPVRFISQIGHLKKMKQLKCSCIYKIHIKTSSTMQFKSNNRNHYRNSL